MLGCNFLMIWVDFLTMLAQHWNLLSVLWLTMGDPLVTIPVDQEKKKKHRGNMHHGQPVVPV